MKATSLLKLIILVGVSNAFISSAIAQQKCIDDSWYDDSVYNTPCSAGSCWVRTRTSSVLTEHPSMSIPSGMIDPAKFFPDLTNGQTSGWAAQCTLGEINSVGGNNLEDHAVCADGLYAYSGKFGADKCQEVGGKLYTCWNKKGANGEIIEGAEDGADYGASDWQVQCQIGSDSLESPITTAPPFPPADEYTVDASIPIDNSATGYAFGWSDSQHALLLDFERTRNIEYLRTFLHRAFYIVSHRDDNISLEGDPVWTYDVVLGESAGTDQTCASAGIDGLVLTSMAEFLFMYAQKNYIFTQAVKNELSLDEAKEYFETIITQTTDFHREISWNEGIDGFGTGTYKMHQQCDEKEGSGARTLRDLPSLPFNLTTAMGRVHFMLYKSNGEQAHLDRALAIAGHLAANFSIFETTTNHAGSDGLQWPYWSVDPLSPTDLGVGIPEDLTHGVVVLNFIKMLTDNNVAFNDQHLTDLFKTIQGWVLRNSDKVRQYIGTRAEPSFTSAEARGITVPVNEEAKNFGRSVAGWFPVMDKAWIKYANDYYVPATGGSESHKLAVSNKAAYTRAGMASAGSACKIDGQCDTDICFQGAVCSGPIYAPSTSTCNRDKECDSGFCTFDLGYGRKICKITP